MEYPKYPSREDIKKYVPTKEERDIIASGLFRKENRIFYQRVEKGKYKIYCSNCQRYEIVSAKILKQIRASKICPICYSEIKSTSNKTQIAISDYVSIEDTYGFDCLVKWEFGGAPRTTKLKQFAYYLSKAGTATYCSSRYTCGYQAYIREVGINMSGNISPCFDRPWTFTTNGRYFDNAWNYNRFATLYELQQGKTKKEYLEQITKGFEFKSNQKEIIVNNLVNKYQIFLIKAFDLKSLDDVLKYREYVNNSQRNYYYWSENNIGDTSFIETLKLACQYNLNIYYLDYLNRNSIKLSDFLDYAKDMKELGFKLDKPSNFKDKHHEIANLVSEKRDREAEKVVELRHLELPSYHCANKGEKEILITPFKSGEEIRKCADKLHNCIAGYIVKYGRKETDLYHLDVNGKLKVAIEVCDGKLKQARAVNNNDCPKELFKHVLAFCKENNFITRSENNYAY